MDLAITVGLDGSAHASAALDLAVRLAARAGGRSRVQCVHVVAVTRRTGRLLADVKGLLGFEPLVVPEAVEAWYRRRGESLLAAAATRVEAAGLACETRLEQGQAAERLVLLGDAADVVVVGARGEGAEERGGALGTVAERVARRSAVPVIVVPAREVALGGITLAFDGSEGARCALRVARNLAKLLACEVQVAVVDDGRRGRPEAPEREAAGSLAAWGVEARAARAAGEAAEVLAALARRAGHDLLVVGARGRTHLGAHNLGRVTERLLDEVDLALVVAR